MLRPLLESISKSARPGDELIVSDDGSTDETAGIVRAFPEFRLVRHEQNIGMVENWNTCLRLASHDWICIVHDDDNLMPGALDTLRSACAKVAQPALITHSHWASETAEFRIRYAEPGRWAVLNCPTIPSGAVIHRGICDDVGFFDPQFKYSADLEYFPRVCARYPLVVIESPGILWDNLHGGNYRFATWSKPDFLQQLERIELAVLEYAGISGEARDRILEQKMDNYCTDMFDNAYRFGDRHLIEHLARQLASRPNVRWRKRLKARLAGYPRLGRVILAIRRLFS
jgi:glycosyltransferase involved in cell wall biosynthesis